MLAGQLSVFSEYCDDKTKRLTVFDTVSLFFTTYARDSAVPLWPPGLPQSIRSAGRRR